ncbi:hypothetical protein CDAR_183871 [Caerostris darwini]|uniref:Uncharacterized protein n=1 Tax=Caerostris darwini TaxID=1538125 RepID=A0AAV4TU62_9ARAC|nr:hypothetical protein CDAR_183871 [Caerostris darwini]
MPDKSCLPGGAIRELMFREDVVTDLFHPFECRWTITKFSRVESSNMCFLQKRYLSFSSSGICERRFWAFARQMASLLTPCFAGDGSHHSF